MNNQGLNAKPQGQGGVISIHLSALKWTGAVVAKALLELTWHFELALNGQQ